MAKIAKMNFLNLNKTGQNHSSKNHEIISPKMLPSKMGSLHIGKKLLLRQKNFYRQTTEKMKVQLLSLCSKSALTFINRSFFAAQTLVSVVMWVRRWTAMPETRVQFPLTHTFFCFFKAISESI